MTLCKACAESGAEYCLHGSSQEPATNDNGDGEIDSYDLSESDAVYFSQVTYPGAVPHYEVKHISEGLLLYRIELRDFETAEREFREYIEQYVEWEARGT